jgi:DNA-binding transcriptional ArsR family regulator
MMPKHRVHLIHTAPQLKALAAAARQELVDVLEQVGTVSVAELAAALDRPADSLYFHLRALTRVGLVRQAGYRARRGGKEALFCTVQPALQLRYEPRNAANRLGVGAVVASMMRLANRDFQRSFRPGHVVVAGDQRELWALRKVGRLSAAQLAGVNRRIQGLADDVAAPHGRGRLYAVTVMLTPLDHRNHGRTRPARARRSARERKNA